MKGPDAGLRKLLRDHMKDYGQWWQAIETGATSAGLPDSHCLGPTGTFWVESKRALSRTGRIKFEPHQVQWLTKHCEWVRTFVAVRLLEGSAEGGETDGIAIYDGRWIGSLLSGGTDSAPAILRYSGDVRRWPWEKIARVFAEGTLGARD